MYAGSRVIAAYIRCLHVSPVGNLHLAHRGRRSTRNPLRKINGWNLDVGKLAVLSIEARLDERSAAGATGSNSLEASVGSGDYEGTTANSGHIITNR